MVVALDRGVRQYLTPSGAKPIPQPMTTRTVWGCSCVISLIGHEETTLGGGEAASRVISTREFTNAPDTRVMAPSFVRP